MLRGSELGGYACPVRLALFPCRNLATFSRYSAGKSSPPPAPPTPPTAVRLSFRVAQDDARD